MSAARRSPPSLSTRTKPPRSGLRGFSFGGRLDYRRVQWEQISRQINALAEVGQRPGPLFVFAHLLLPHGPYVFGPDGEFLPSEVVENRALAVNYINHVRFANVVIRRIVDSITASANARRPVVIIQADEGPFPNRLDVETVAANWRRASPHDLRQKFAILNAIYMPDVAPGTLHPAITPVNTFRVVFNTYFGTRLPMLLDTSFAATNDERPFDFFEVTPMLDP
jgi:membrane-anchored protein YejM (alkaline phosphatase superfamily)